MAVQDTSFIVKYNKYATLCMPVGKALLASNQKLIGHEFLHAYSESDEVLQRLKEIFVNQINTKRPNYSLAIICGNLRKQQDLYQRILSQIPNRNEHFDYLTGLKNI